MPALKGQSIDANVPGVSGENTAQGGTGVVGHSITGRGVHGISDSYLATVGDSTSGTGVYGRSETGTGVVGIITDPKAIGIGTAVSGTVTGIQAIGIYGENNYDTGNLGEGLAGKFKGNVSIMGNLEVHGGNKNFVLDHPTDPTKEIVYTALEGGKAGTYINGTAKLVDGEAVIVLPEHFSLVTDQEGLTIHLTPRGEWLQLYVVELDTRRGVVREAQSKSGQFDYIIHGERKEYKNLQVIRTKRQDVPYNS